MGDLAGDSSEDESGPISPTKSNDQKTGRVQRRKLESLDIYVKFRSYYRDLERRKKALTKTFNEMKEDDFAKQFDQSLATDNNQYYCQVCRYSMDKELQTVHEFLHKES